MKIYFTPLIAILLTGLSSLAQSAETATKTNALRTFETRGVIRDVPAAGRTLVVRHEEIPGYMPRMTMELNVRDTNEIRNLKRDDIITFKLVATDDAHWIENIRTTGRAESPFVPPIPLPGLEEELQPGDPFPDAELLDEHGRKFRFSDLQGQVVAFSLFFTRCPLPEFCPLMNKNFAKAREELRTGAGGATNWLFLSISFDATFDSPGMLASYAPAYRGTDASHWIFASASQDVVNRLAPKIDFMLTREGEGFAHNLRTVVIGPNRRVQRIFAGNEWKPKDLAEEMKRSLQSKP